MKKMFWKMSIPMSRNNFPTQNPAYSDSPQGPSPQMICDRDPAYLRLPSGP